MDSAPSAWMVNKQGSIKRPIFLPSLEDPSQAEEREFYTPSALSVLNEVNKAEKEKSEMVSQKNAYTINAAITVGAVTQYAYFIVFPYQMRYEVVGQGATLTAYPSWFASYSSKLASGTLAAFTIQLLDDWFSNLYPNYGSVFEHNGMVSYPTLEDIKDRLYEIRNQWVIWQDYIPSIEEYAEYQDPGIGFPHIPGFNPFQYSGWFFYGPQMMFIAKDLTAQAWIRFNTEAFIIFGFRRDSAIPGKAGMYDLLVYPLLEKSVYSNAPKLQINLISIRDSLPGMYLGWGTRSYAWDQEIPSLPYYNPMGDWLGVTTYQSDIALAKSVGRQIVNAAKGVSGGRETTDSIAAAWRLAFPNRGDDYGMG